ncbi:MULTISPECIES: DUF438 domain-containing protein [Clostridium]|jgi:Uncharacterized conserved protein|uniref:DUF438 domain-containing protein n=1 Tax=Clostridium beijerinckii TaxID=1520 RepID=A0AAE5LRM0_CLOBE|nr:DUF438 domain-containing protein [Clostridium beijerinckii]ALB47276.1 DUF438 domain-containing protein [Clostridium beijerinckii NRRL B-598]MBC2459029.1 DUF438 domain-containing protein [Clostridium beijerinckii]MBC2475313.1 DUF438 domain-containing protein [Clostridium beijerinckii]MDG5853119.1 DUF438 domain-containing protein [Clostridium beijerinckii]NOV58930.1 hypothetical protein [Clostridium beijerinckii]
MNNSKIQSLTEVLQKLNKDGITETLRKEALEIVSDINPIELSIAEQNLIEEGMNPQDLRHLCDIHMEVLRGELDKIKNKIEPGHVVYTFIAEHDKILGFLKELEDINSKIQKLESYDSNLIEFEELIKVIDNILDAENHHKREEKVLFAEMEDRKITGPTRIMRMEHDDLRAKKKFLKQIATEVSKLKFIEFKEKVDETAKYIIFNLRDHIFKENYILYPTAVEAITEKDVWNSMKTRCDEIGYCSFTPES